MMRHDGFGRPLTALVFSRTSLWKMTRPSSFGATKRTVFWTKIRPLQPHSFSSLDSWQGTEARPKPIFCPRGVDFFCRATTFCSRAHRQGSSVPSPWANLRRAACSANLLENLLRDLAQSNLLRELARELAQRTLSEQLA